MEHLSFYPASKRAQNNKINQNLSAEESLSLLLDHYIQWNTS